MRVIRIVTMCAVFASCYSGELSENILLGLGAVCPDNKERKHLYSQITDETKADLGFGTFGRVYTLKFEGKDLAVKRIYLKDDFRVAEAINEVRALKKLLNHEGIIQFQDCQVIGNSLYIGQELISHDLGNEKFSNIVKDMTLREKLSYTSDLAKTVALIHDKRIIHGDLKPANYGLVINPAPGKMKVKLLDWGKACLNEPTTGYGTLKYFSPRMLNPVYKLKTEDEVWALGISLLELFFGKIENYSSCLSEAYKKHLYQEFERDCVECLDLLYEQIKKKFEDTPTYVEVTTKAEASLLKWCIVSALHRDESKRPSAKEIFLKIESFYKESRINEEEIIIPGKISEILPENCKKETKKDEQIINDESELKGKQIFDFYSRMLDESKTKGLPSGGLSDLIFGFDQATFTNSGSINPENNSNSALRFI
jgi:serine/threonine protein kinase